MHILYNLFQSWKKNNPYHQQRFHIFGRERPIYFVKALSWYTYKSITKEELFQGLVLTKNSPLTPVFKAGIMALRENSLMDYLMMTWIGRRLENTRGGPSSSEQMVLTAGQVILHFNTSVQRSRKELIYLMPIKR